MVYTALVDDRLILSLAPFQGITDSLFRRIFFSCFSGYDRAYAPFIKAVAGKASDSHYRDVRGEAGAPYGLVPQLLCNRGDELLESARRLAGMGFREVNLNMGCPFPMVANKKRGSGILPHPEMVDRMLSQALPACPLKVSVKLRLGRKSAQEMRPILDVLNRHPLTELILHPRTGIQMYRGSVDLEGFGEFLSLSRHPVAYNGDILSLGDFQERRRRFPSVAHWMLGRGALRNPFLAAEIKGHAPGAEERSALIKRLHDEYFSAQAARFGSGKQLLDIMKALWTYLAWSLHEPEAFLVKARRIKDMERYTRLIQESL
jgi:tRNA-dihydrouridine synthase B